MGHLISGGETLPIIIQRKPESGYSEMLDGKQRTEAILAWLHGKITAKLSDGMAVHIDDVEGGIKGARCVDMKIKYVNLPFEERKRFYVRFNSAGTPHTKEELEEALNAKP
jgi:hypothetical protein